MTQLSSLARILFALAMAAFAVLTLVSGELIRAPESFAPHPIFLYLSSALLGASAIAIAVKRLDYLAAIALGIAFGLCFVLLHMSTLIAQPRDGNAWAAAVATLALSGMSLVLAARCLPSTAGEGVVRMLGAAGRIMFGVCLPVCGIQHFMYASFVATFIPAWIPMPLWWAYFTGVCHLAAGVSMITRLWIRSSALLAGLMFFLFLLLVHVPRVARDPGNVNEWISLFIAVAFCASAWLMASHAPELSRRTQGRAQVPRFMDRSARYETFIIDQLRCRQRIHL